MGWLRSFIGTRSLDVAERLTGRGLFRTTRDTAALSDDETVRRWLSELQGDQHVLVHRPWGTVAAASGRRGPIKVFLADGEISWFAVPPEADDDVDLTPEQVSLVVIDALTAPSPPRWPDWRRLA
jgi:hypothetical protein